MAKATNKTYTIEKKHKGQAINKRSSGHGRKVWHITRFHERYELPDDVRFDRKSPLLYTKDFVGSGTDDESCSYFRQIMSLRTRPNWLVLRGAFAELKNISANSSKVYRGYLLDSNFQPASDEQIGSWLGLDIKESKELLKQLSLAGLIEQVTMPDFEPDNKPKTKKKTTKKSKGKTKVTGTKNPAEKNLVDSRTRSSFHEVSRDALNKKTKVNAKTKTNGNEKIKEKINIGSLNHNTQEGQKESSQGQDVKLSNLSPPTTQPILPLKSDEPGTKLIQFDQSPESVMRTRTGSTHSEPQQIGDIARGMMFKYSPDAKAFAGDVFAALQLKCHPCSDEGKRELGSFASVWMDATYSGLSPPELNRLREHAVAEATKIKKYWKSRPGKIQAVWCSVFKKMLNKAKTRECKVM